MRQTAKNILNGKEVIISGVLKADKPIIGRTLIADLEHGLSSYKQVDNRTINWLILKGVKYVVE
jgi:hypothetical protein